MEQQRGCKALKPSSSSSSSFSSLQQAYSEWMKYRRQSIPLFQELVNAKNKLSYVKQNKVTLVGVLTTSKKISSQIFDEIFEIIGSLDEVHGKMLLEMRAIETIQAELEVIALPVEESCLVEVLEKLKKQTSLEITLLNRLRELGHGGDKDQDLSITIMACLTYPPYSGKDDINQLLEIQVSSFDK